MTWMKHLYDTFENNIDTETEIPLMPISHMAANAHIEVTLTPKGNFRGAVIVDKKDCVTRIPVTEDSASRTANTEPHPLYDLLPYVAGDFRDFCKSQKQKQSAEKKFKAYIGRLKGWADDPLSHPTVKTIYTYLEKECLAADLISAEILETKADGCFDMKKINGQPYEKCLVRFSILFPESDRDILHRTWEDESLVKAHIEYNKAHQTNPDDVCYFSGEMVTIARKHPKGTLPFKRDAKLVSTNDTEGYTYRGRFLSADEAYAFGYEASQKIHSALAWVVKKYGVYVGSQDTRVFACWNPNGKALPDIFKAEAESALTEPEYREKLRKTLKGYTKELDGSDPVVILGLGAPTTGRLAIVYYQEQPASLFLENVAHWRKTCSWSYLKFTEEKKPYWEIETPVFKRIISYAFGREKDNFVEVDERILKQQIPRLLTCMLERHPIPFDIVQALVARASTPLAYSRGNRERILSTACAVYRKYQHDKANSQEVPPMELDITNHNRSYLFGRLLAVYETVERRTYDPGETRDPNAIRLWSAYTNNPMQTWNTLEKAVNPYFQKLKPGSREFFRQQISTIVESFEENDPGWLNQKLDPDYLLGYYMQRAEFRKKKADESESAKEEPEE